MKALTLLTVRCRGAPEVKAFMLEKRVSPLGNLQTNWRVCAHVALTSLCGHAHGYAPRRRRAWPSTKWTRFFSEPRCFCLQQFANSSMFKSQFGCFKEQNQVLFSCLSTEGGLSGATNQEVGFLIVENRVLLSFTIWKSRAVSRFVNTVAQFILESDVCNVIYVSV